MDGLDHFLKLETLVLKDFQRLCLKLFKSSEASEELRLKSRLTLDSLISSHYDCCVCCISLAFLEKSVKSKTCWFSLPVLL